MFVQSRTLLSCAPLIGLVAFGTAALLVDRAAAPNRIKEQPTTAQESTQTRLAPQARNLSLQPEALKLARHLGARFLAPKDTTSVMTATLKIGSDARTIQMTRAQTEDGESVQIAIDSSSGPFTWDAKQGGLTSGRQPGPTERELIERLVFDSPDQFVLMQFRGASYYTVARAVRPVDAPDGYEGPLWTIVRTDDPEQDEAKRPVSRWRLYYINAATGLIDRIESEVQGQRIVAEISSWTEQNGERLPAKIIWRRDGQTLMQYSLMGFSQSQN
jgi:hypothetical protein